VRAAQRSKTKAPRLVCTFTENDSIDSKEDAGNPPAEVVIGDPKRSTSSGPAESRRESGIARKIGSVKKIVVGVEKEKGVRREEEKETLLARIGMYPSLLRSDMST